MFFFFKRKFQGEKKKSKEKLKCALIYKTCCPTEKVGTKPVLRYNFQLQKL